MALLALCWVAAMFGTAACTRSGPPPNEYMLGALPSAKAIAINQTGLPIVELKRLQFPDYLDTTEILERRGNRLVPSASGRWGERLSVGMTRSLTASLAARLPRMAVTATPPVERPAREILIDVDAFEWRDDGQVVLVARWSIADGSGRHIVISQQAALVEAVVGTGDSAVVAAMSHAVEDLAEQIAEGIETDRLRK